MVPFEGVAIHLVDVEESDLPTQESLYRYFVSRVQHRGGRPSPSARLVAELQAGEGLQIRLLEVEGSQSDEVESA